MKQIFTQLKAFGILLLLFVTISESHAQLTYVATPGGSSSANFRGPCGSCGFQRYVGVYPAAELSSIIPANDSIRALSFNILTPQATAVSGNIIILMSNTADVDYQKGASWSAAVANMDTVYNGPMTVPNTAGFYDVVFQNAIEYTGGGAYVAYEWTTSGTLAAGEPTYVANTSIDPGMARNQSTGSHSDALGAAAVWRVQLRLAFATAAIDLSASNPGTSSSPCGSPGATFDLRVDNAGSSAVDTIFYHYDVTGPGTALSTDTFEVSTLNSGDSLIISNSFTLASSGDYFFTAYLTQPNDAINLNDTVSNLKVTKFDFVNSFPYTENFDGASQGWSSNAIAGLNDWALATPASTIINSASSAPNSWVTNAAGNYSDGHDAWVNSPCFDFTSVVSPTFSADIWYDIETDWDAAILEASSDNGATWSTVGGLNTGINWYNSNSPNLVLGLPAAWNGDGASGTQGWVRAEHPLTGYAGLPSVRLRMRFISDGSANNEGFAFDNVEVSDAAGVAPTADFTFAVNLLVADFTDASTGSIDSWSWDFGDGNTDTVASPTHTYANDGDYEVCLTVTNVSGNSTFCDSVSVNALGLSNNLSQQLSIFPNPASNSIQFSIKAQLNGNLEVRVLDLMGKTRIQNHYSVNTELFNQSIEIRDLSPGIYLLELQSEGKRAIKRFIKE